MHPTIGRIVHYRSKTGNYTLPAIITATTETLWPGGVEREPELALSSELHVHLHVLTPGAQGDYTEHDVPCHEALPVESPEAQAPGTWRWPPRFTEAELKGGGA